MKLSKISLLAAALLVVVSFVMPSNINATSQWAKKTGLSCNSCHTVFPRLNSFGEEYLKNGYQLMTTYKKDYKEAYPIEAGGVLLDEVSNIFGFRLNMTPIGLETKSFQEDFGKEKTTKLTLGSPVWLQMFVAGSIYKDISFFSELEYSKSSFKFNWFYFNFTNLLSSQLLNFQVGNISPMEFASYPNRLPQLPNLKGEVFLRKSSNGKGESSMDMSSARPGVQYYGTQDWATVYLGISPGTNAASVNQFLNFWGGLVLKLPENVLQGFDGSTATIHYYTGTDTKFTGVEKDANLNPLPADQQKAQIENSFTRISPQINIRYNDMFDLQAAYVSGTDDNYGLSTTAKEFKYSGFALEAGYMPTEIWHLAVHYDKYTSEDEVGGIPVLNYQRIVPAVTYIINQNLRFTVYYEKDITPDKNEDLKVDKAYLNIRVMF